MGHEGRSWLDRCRLYRDRLIASPRVQRWALANPVTRPVAQRRARAMLDLCAGFVGRRRPLTWREAAPLRHPVQGAPDHCRACREAVAFAGGYVPPPRCRGFTWASGAAWPIRRRAVQLGAALAGNRAALSLIEHQPLLYADLQDPVALLRGSPRGTGIARYLPYSAAAHPTELAEEEVASYSALMTASQPLIARGSARTPIRSTGIAAFSTWAVAKEFSSLRRQRGRRPYASCFSICPLWPSGLVPACSCRTSLERASIYGGNFLTNPLPEGADIYRPSGSFMTITDASALSLLRAVRRALSPDGTLLIAEAMSGVRGAEPLDAYYGFTPLPWAEASQEPRRKSADCCGTQASAASVFCATSCPS